MRTLTLVISILIILFASSGCRVTKNDLIGKYTLIDPNHKRKGTLELMPNGRLREAVEKFNGGSFELVGSWEVDPDGHLWREPCVGFDGFSNRDFRVAACGSPVERFIRPATLLRSGFWSLLREGLKRERGAATAFP